MIISIGIYIHILKASLGLEDLVSSVLSSLPSIASPFEIIKIDLPDKSQQAKLKMDHDSPAHRAQSAVSKRTSAKSR